MTSAPKAIDWQADLDLIAEASRKAGAVALSFFGQSPEVWWKHEGRSPVSAADYAANKSLEEMAKFLEVDSLGFLSVDGLYQALEAGPRDPAHPQFTDHYFTGDYPTRLIDREIAEGRNEAVERQLSFLQSA